MLLRALALVTTKCVRSLSPPTVSSYDQLSGVKTIVGGATTSMIDTGIDSVTVRPSRSTAVTTAWV